MSNLTPRSIIEFDISSIENEKDDLDNDEQGNMEILPPGPVKQIFDDHFCTEGLHKQVYLLFGLILIDKFKNIQIPEELFKFHLPKLVLLSS